MSLLNEDGVRGTRVVVRDNQLAMYIHVDHGVCAAGGAVESERVAATFLMHTGADALQEVGFKGVAIPDHIPRLCDDPRAGTAYLIGQMQVLKRWAEEAVGG